MKHPKAIRLATLVIGAGLGLYALNLYLMQPWALQLWIWPNTPPLGCAFVAGMLAGAAAPLVWIGLSGHLAAIRAAMLAGIVANAGIGGHLFARHAVPGNERYLPFAVLFALGALLAAGVFVRTAPPDPADDAPTPPIVRAAFLAFAAILLPVGLALVLDVPHVFPIPLTPDMAAVYGWFFLGSFAYYAYGCWKPSRLNATGQLLSFLAYDLLMLPPYMTYRHVVYASDQGSLFIYLGVLLASAAFCLYAVVLDPRTRLLGRPARIARMP